MTEKKKLKVNIFDKDYSLLVDNEDLAAELALYVNNIMNETKNEMPNQPTETVAIIAALNIAYDLFLEKNKFREFSIQATDKVKKIKLLLSESKIMSSPS
ncbi:MAG: cell division protein ZapA [Ignavibacteriales bacterium CG18_big_fil_WC_8_21_14_2_50_31_20]|nr:MAG: cell division protein ZapA [Ignavibacteriales bacterium CG18_big_fil_WC_8_21_14_2_50_31_20]